MKIKLENISETFVKELCKEPNIKEAFIREGIIEEINYGSWIKDDSEPDWLTRYEKNKNYGVDYKGNWFENSYNYTLQPEDRLATTQEVETALINEAKNRGYENKITTIVLENKTYMLEFEKGTYQLIGNILFYQGAPIFNNGTWAKIIEENRPIKIPLKYILATPNDMELGKLVRNLINY